MFNKYLRFTLALVILMALIVACGEDEEPTSTSPPAAEEQPEPTAPPAAEARRRLIMPEAGKRATVDYENILEAGRSVWLASVVAFTTVADEASDLFDHLVQRGEQLRQRERTAVEKSLELTRDRVLEMGRTVEKRAEKQLSGALHRFGVPTRKEVQKLINRVEQLTKKVDAISQQQ